MSETPPDSALPSRQGQAWSVKEDQDLYEAFVDGQPAAALAAQHQRSPGAIRSRLVRLGLVDENGANVQPVPPFEPVARKRSSTQAEAPGQREDKSTARPVFAVRTEDGWAVEIRSNRPLSRALVERLTAMLRGLVPDADT